LKQVIKAFSFIQKSIEIINRPENKAKYQFLIYNASITTWHIIRPLIKPGWAKSMAEIVEKLSNLLEDNDDSDYNWRYRYMAVLVQSFMDADKKPDALKILDKLWEATKKRGDCNFLEVLFRTRTHLYRDNNGVLANIKKDTEIGDDKLGFKTLYVLQTLRSGVIPDPQVEKELQACMQILSPASVQLSEGADKSSIPSNTKISPINQDRLAEAGRLAIKHNLIPLCEGACNVISRASQGSLRAKIWTEYSKAELILKKPKSEVDLKTGMKLNTLQKQIEEFDRRVEALKLLDRAMIANKRLADPYIIIEGCILIWNTGLPLLKKTTRHHVYKPFQAAANLLEQIQANENVLRVCLHLELAKYEMEQDFLSKAAL
jgi:hypothetical protein